MSVRVLVVEDEPLVAEAHAEYTRRVAGFDVVGVAHSATEAARMLGDREVDLVLLDMYLPDGHGLGLLRNLRAGGALCDVIAVTSARDAEMVRRAVAHGVVLYLIKPFTFPMFRAKLEQYADYRRQLGDAPDAGDAGRGRPDARLAARRHRPTAPCPRGSPRSGCTRRWTTSAPLPACCRRASSRRSWRARGSPPGATSSTSPTSGSSPGRSRYGGSGRPEVEYRWQHSTSSR